MHNLTLCMLRRRFKDHALTCQHPGIDAVCLCEAPDCLCKSARLLRIDLDEGPPRQTKISLKATVMGASRFKDDQNALLAFKPGAQVAKAVFRIWKAARF